MGNGYTITYNSNDKGASGDFTLGVRGGTLNLGNPDKTDTLTITTNNKQNHSSPLISVLGGGTVNMYDGVTLTGNICTSSNAGGVDIQSGTFNMYGGEISNCESLFGYGGGVWVLGRTSTFHMYGGAISGNKATGFHTNGKSYGGGVLVFDGATFIMSGGMITKNHAWNSTENTVNNYGGGVCIYLATATITGGKIEGNCCDSGRGYGGGVCNYFGSLEVKNCSITDNKANFGGGAAVYSVNNSEKYPGQMIFENCAIQNNTAEEAGGA